MAYSVLQNKIGSTNVRYVLMIWSVARVLIQSKIFSPTYLKKNQRKYSLSIQKGDSQKIIKRELPINFDFQMRWIRKVNRCPVFASVIMQFQEIILKVTISQSFIISFFNSD